MNLETKITIYKFTPQVFTLTRKKQLPPAKKKSAYCPILFGLLINGKRSDTASCTAPPWPIYEKNKSQLLHITDRTPSPAFNIGLCPSNSISRQELPFLYIVY